MSLMTTWTTSLAPSRPVPAQRRHPGLPRPAWDCENCLVPNPGSRKRCTDCGTTRD